MRGLRTSIKAGECAKTGVCRLGSRHGKLKACATGFIVFAVGYAAFGQQQAPVAKFTASSQLVVEVVSVKDKNGNPVAGLTAKDFVVTENGAPQNDHVLRIPEAGRHARGGGWRRKSRRLRRIGARAGNADGDCAGGSGRYPLPRPAAAGAVFRHDGHAGAGPTAGPGGGAESSYEKQMTKADLMAIMKYDGGGGAGAAGFHRRAASNCSAVHRADGGRAKGRGSTKMPTTTARPTRAPHSARTIANSTSSTPTGNWRRCRPR